MRCRSCAEELRHVFIDLGTVPPSNAYVPADKLQASEPSYPLRILICDNCWLLQTEDFARPDSLFTDDYAYFSSFSESWLAHCERYAEAMISRFELGATSTVAEIAANDGYLLQYFKNRGVPCYGIEPTASTATVARSKGIDIVEDFFGERLASVLAADGRSADLTAAKNVLAHVPDIIDFVTGFSILLRPTGVATFEFPHLYQLVEQTQFDTIYHEHYSYLSFGTVLEIFERTGLCIFDVEELSTHGGSLRVYAQRRGTGQREVSDRVGALLHLERDAGMQTLGYYAGFQGRAEAAKDAFVRYLLDAKRQGLRVAAYGAAAKGNTLINYAGIGADLLPYVVDRNPRKQGKYLPGSRIPIVGEERIWQDRPQRVIILPWNIADEIKGQLAYIHEWGGRCLRALPTPQEL